MSTRYMVYDTVANVWLKGIEDNRATYTSLKGKAMRFKTKREADKAVQGLGQIWKTNVKVIETTE